MISVKILGAGCSRCRTLEAKGRPIIKMAKGEIKLIIYSCYATPKCHFDPAYRDYCTTPKCVISTGGRNPMLNSYT